MRFVERQGDRPSSLDVDALIDALTSYPIELGILFGSFATGTDHPLSDLDVAVAFESNVPTSRRRAMLDELTADVIRATGFEAIDLIDLDSAPPELGYAILSDGRLLIGDEDTAAAREATVLLRKLDLQPVKAAWRAALSDRIDEGTYGRS